MLILAEYDVVDEGTETDDTFEVLGQFELTVGKDEMIQTNDHDFATTKKRSYQKVETL